MSHCRGCSEDDPASDADLIWCLHCGGSFHPVCHPVLACIEEDAGDTGEVYCECQYRGAARCECPCHRMALAQVEPSSEASVFTFLELAPSAHAGNYRAGNARDISRAERNRRKAERRAFRRRGARS